MFTKIGLSIIGISTWTLVQTLFHIIWIIYSYFWTICLAQPTHYDVVFLYLTYFYRNDCGKIKLANEALILNETITELYFVSVNETSSRVLYEFLKDVLDYGEMPPKTSVARRTDLYLLLFFCTDVAWAATAILMLVAAFRKGKSRFSANIFLAPWMFVTAFVTFLDVVSSVHFGLDMVYIQSYSTWLKFIGVANFKYFEQFNNRTGATTIPAIPTSIFISLSSRFFVVWLFNIICFSIILFIAIPSMNSRQGLKARKSTVSNLTTLRVDTGRDLDCNSSEARIRNWQLFYEAIDANSTMNSSSPNTTSNSIEGLSSIKLSKKDISY